MIENGFWLLVVAGGPLVIAILLAYALFTRRRLSPGERRKAHDATERLYREKPR